MSTSDDLRDRPHGVPRDSVDILELKAMRTALENDRDSFERLMRQISHALQEPIRAICSFGQLLEGEDRSGLSKQAQEYLSFILRGSRQIQFSMQGWIRLAHVVTRVQPAIPVDLRMCLDSVLAMLRPALEDQDVNFNVGPLPLVLGPPNHMIDLLREPIVNALDARREDRLQIGIHARTVDGRVHVTIEDNGRGMDVRKLRRTDQIFPQEPADKTGFGLLVCHQIVARLGGSLQIESKPELGTTVRFDLPAAPQPAAGA